MKSKELIRKLKKTVSFKKNIDAVKVLQTHISYVILTGEYAFKIKKPLDLGFLNFSTLEQRKYYCEQELKLNKRLCPKIYEKVVTLTEKEGEIEIDGTGKVVDYAVKMKEFPQSNIMSSLLDKDKIGFEKIEDLVENLVNFYKSEQSTDEIKKFGKIKTIKQNTDENFEQTEAMLGGVISEQNYEHIKKITNQYLIEFENVFKKRITNNCIKDCHGDLHTGNIVLLNGKICIFDCIEFNKRFRYCDIASDIAFLAMDLDVKGHGLLSSFLIESYIKKSKDTSIFDVLSFYKCYRAYVRAKVTGFRLSDKSIEPSERKQVKETTSRYFELASYYARLMEYKLEQENQPVLFITSGLTGTGKSTAAKKIKIDYDATIVSTDEVRKRLEGVNKYEAHHDDYNLGMYSPKKNRDTYNEVFKIGKELLNKGKNVILDATFKTEELRIKAKHIARQNNAKLIIINTVCPEEVIQKHLEARAKLKSISDGRWEIYIEQKKSFEDFKGDIPRIEIDTSKKTLEYQLNIFNTLLDAIQE